MAIRFSGLVKQLGFSLNESPAVTAAGLAAKASGPLAQVQGALSGTLRNFGAKVGNGIGYNPFAALSAGAGATASESNLALIEQNATPTEWLIAGVVVGGLGWLLYKAFHRG